MDKIEAVARRNPVALAKGGGSRFKHHRLAKGWTQEGLAEKSGVAVSTLKLLESKGRGSFQRFILVAVALGVDGDLRGLFAQTGVMESIEEVKRSERKRAPHRKKSVPSI